MRLMGRVGTVIVLLCVVACSGKDKKDDNKSGKDGNGTAKPRSNTEKIVGKWKVTKSPGDIGTILEFAGEGKGTFREGENAKRGEDFTYKVEGDKLTVTSKEAGKEVRRTQTIKSLNDTTLILVEKGEEIELTRMK
jgi:uncharacterized protein (TIGR03066 family)